VITLFTYQIVPGSDELLGFTERWEDCVRDTRDQRAELRAGREAMPSILGAMAVYRFEFRQPTPAELVRVLNGDYLIVEIAPIDRRLVGAADGLHARAR
jgi:hypothetical protein